MGFDIKSIFSSEETDIDNSDVIDIKEKEDTVEE